jgi:hypothetical protein
MWAWTGDDWLELQPRDRPERGGTIGSTATGLVLLVAGQETWLWGGADWRRANPVVNANGFESQEMAYDGAADETVAVGGHSAFAGDIVWQCWIWNGANWRRQS